MKATDPQVNWASVGSVEPVAANQVAGHMIPLADGSMGEVVITFGLLAPDVRPASAGASPPVPSVLPVARVVIAASRLEEMITTMQGLLSGRGNATKDTAEPQAYAEKGPKKASTTRRRSTKKTEGVTL